jgi:F-type H+-transporting ATPase subunit delta
VNFLLLVMRKGRQLFLRRMLADYCVLHDERMGLVRAKATTAVPLGSESLEALRAVLQAKLGKTVQLDNAVDEGILGGLIVRYGGMVADGSLGTALVRIESRTRDLKFGSEFVHEN